MVPVKFQVQLIQYWKMHKIITLNMTISNMIAKYLRNHQKVLKYCLTLKPVSYIIHEVT